MLLIILLISGCRDALPRGENELVVYHDTLLHRQCRDAISDQFVSSNTDNNLIRRSIARLARESNTTSVEIMKNNCYGYMSVGATYCVAIFSTDLSDEEAMYCYPYSSLNN